MDSQHLFLDSIIAIVIILIASKTTGKLITYIGQPKVVGEMIAGVLLGPTLLGNVSTELMNSIFTINVKDVLFVLSSFGLAFYMFLIGAETDLSTFNKKSIRSAGSLALSGILFPFLLGVSIAYLLYDTLSLQTITPFNFAIFMGSAMSITAFPMLARILDDEGLIKTKFGSLSLLAASIDDALAWCLLAVVIAMAQAKSLFTGLYIILITIVFVIVVMYLVKPIFKKIGDKIEKLGFMSNEIFGVIIIIISMAAYFTEFIGIHAVFGGFIIGIAMPRGSVFQSQIKEKMSGFVSMFFLPLFFTYSGLGADLSNIFNPHLLIPAIIIVIASMVGKYAGCALAMRKAGFSWGESSAIGGLMNSRGLMELIIVNIGLSYSIISQDLYSILVLMAVITTALALPIYKISMKRG